VFLTAMGCCSGPTAQGYPGTRVSRRLPGPDQRRRRGAVAATLALTLAVSTGCASDQEKYCDAVEDHQQELGEVLGGGAPDALLEALPIFRDLADQAPEDLRDEWKTVVDAVAGLQQALEDAGVDPASYDRDHPPDGMTQADRDAIDAAARRLASEETESAFTGIDQQAKDVCGTLLQIG
jgi:hypothetical protein